MKKLAIAVLLASASTVAVAKPATTYDNVALSYVNWKFDDVDLTLKGFAFDGTKLMTENLYVNTQIIVVGDQESAFGSTYDLDTRELKISLGYNLSLAEQTDAYVQFGLVRQSVKTETRSNNYREFDTESDSGTSILVGVKHNFGKFEGGVFAERLNGGGDDETSNIYGVDGRYKFTDNFHAVAQYGKESDFNYYKVGVSYAF